jgi:hypothetical protein
MPDALNRAKRYRELSAGCRDLAAIGLSAETRNHFLRMAEHYSTLASEEEADPLPDMPGDQPARLTAAR